MKVEGARRILFVLSLILMVQRSTLLLSALVAFNAQIPDSSAAPFSPQGTAWVVSTDLTCVETTPANVAALCNLQDVSVSSPISSSEPSTTRDDTEPVIQQATQTSGADVARGSWVLPERFKNLSPLGIKKLAFGSQNIKVVTGIPARASDLSISSSLASEDPELPNATPLPRPWTNSSSAYRLFYPSGSVNPGNRPQGGAEIYATPGDLPYETAKSVTLEYSVFFPADFEWVRGGKLPGLYGGHEGCSGGNSAESCFSTRLMWRNGGAGELYLYAPKDKQTPELCNAPPQSVCDADWGLSVGRGSFYFARGSWTHVKQTVTLNTPGEQNGGFELLVNGGLIMRRNDVFYRDVPTTDDAEEDDAADNLLQEASQLLGYDVTESRHQVIPQLQNISMSEMFEPDIRPVEVPWGVPDAQKPMSVVASPVRAQSSNARAVGFSGLFFSTFFGGHDRSWASPKNQYTWFKDFGMKINS